MLEKQINVFLPCRKGSERVPGKNTRKFSDFENGLIEIKLAQLEAARLIDKIYLSTDDERILDYVSGRSSEKIITHHRSVDLATSTTSTDSLIKHACQLITKGQILWTHVTSPFFNASAYDQMIKRYFAMLDEGFDSLMTVTELRGFIWNEEGPLTYDRAIEKWPRTQTLSPLLEVNSAAFISSRENYLNHEDRIGLNPYPFRISKIEAFDIDWPEDFLIAEAIASSSIVKLD